MKSGLEAGLEGVRWLKFVVFCYKIEQISVGDDRDLYIDCLSEKLFVFLKSRVSF